jgi:hypothetical protein
MDRVYIEAVDLLGSFKLNDKVRVTLTDDTPRDMYVSRTLHRCDGKFGSYESSRVTVTYGPGRYATSITADMLVHHRATIEKREEVEEQPAAESVCFCGEDIDYDKPGDEGGEFIATEEFVKDHPKYSMDRSVIAHAECGLGAGLEPA